MTTKEAQQEDDPHSFSKLAAKMMWNNANDNGSSSPFVKNTPSGMQEGGGQQVLIMQAKQQQMMSASNAFMSENSAFKKSSPKQGQLSLASLTQTFPAAAPSYH
jgi:hypothetical protein